MIRVSTRLVAVAAGTLLVAAFSFPPSLAQAPSGNTVALTGNNELAHAPHDGQNFLQHGLRPVEFFCKNAVDFGLDWFGVEEFASSRFGHLQEGAGHAAEDERRDNDVGVENDANHSLAVRLEARNSWTRRSTSCSRMPWRSALERPYALMSSHQERRS